RGRDGALGEIQSGYRSCRARLGAEAGERRCQERRPELDQAPPSAVRTHADYIDEADRLLRDGGSTASRDCRHPRPHRRHALLRRFPRRHRDVWGEGGAENGNEKAVGSINAVRSCVVEMQSLPTSAPRTKWPSCSPRWPSWPWTLKCPVHRLGPRCIRASTSRRAGNGSNTASTASSSAILGPTHDSHRTPDCHQNSRHE